VAKLVLIELNEINFDFVAEYARQGKLPVLAELIAAHGLRQTISETRYEELEPWIQWVTAHTGLSFAEHRVFRLGDIVERELPQVWEQLEQEGYRVGAISPMNASNRTRDAAFFMPDPWTRTRLTGSRMLRTLHGAVCEAVGDNAEARMSPSSLARIVAGLAVYARARNYPRYARLLSGGLRRRWLRALLLDTLLGDIFIGLTKSKQPDFASIFVNAGAHIQHHYMFSSSAYRGAARNPPWYAPADADPVLDACEAYDRMIGHALQALPGYRLMIATGLRQIPHRETTFYWRLRDHADFLRRIGIVAQAVEPRMSRDFIVRFSMEGDARRAAALLSACRADDGIPLFEVDDRGLSLFVMLTYARDVGPELGWEIEGMRHPGLRNEIAFVAIKNGEHDGAGFFIDTGLRAGEGTAAFELRELPRRIRDALRN
jgi:hypothetical protein